MRDLNAINKEREGRANLSQYKELIETVSKVEFKKFSTLGLMLIIQFITLQQTIKKIRAYIIQRI